MKHREGRSFLPFTLIVLLLTLLSSLLCASSTGGSAGQQLQQQYQELELDRYFRIEQKDQDDTNNALVYLVIGEGAYLQSTTDFLLSLHAPGRVFCNAPTSLLQRGLSFQMVA